MTLGGSAVVEQNHTPPATPKDATEATDEQREMQDKLEHQNDDPDAPARNQTHHQIPDEN